MATDKPISDYVELPPDAAAEEQTPSYKPPVARLLDHLSRIRRHHGVQPVGASRSAQFAITSAGTIAVLEQLQRIIDQIII